MPVKSTEAQSPPFGEVWKFGDGVSSQFIFLRTLFPLDTATIVFVVVSFPKRRNESCQSLIQVGFLQDRERHSLSPPPQFRHGTGGEGNILHLYRYLDTFPTQKVAFSEIEGRPNVADHHQHNG
ncbi:hypothetical protein TNCV_3310271 [Trichonephila clavipes]|nr:hypothetical protein TNCV_3310271 [Trichonephila clavipes]